MAESNVEYTEENVESEDANEEENDGYIKVAAAEDAEITEFPIEDNDTIMFSTIQAQFPNASGIKFKGPSGSWRAIRAVDNVLDPPKGGWGNRVYVISVIESIKESNATKTNKEKSEGYHWVKPESTKDGNDEETRKRKADDGNDADDDDNSQPKKSSIDPLLKDLPVTGLPYNTTTEEMREYFEENYGELDLCEIKNDYVTKKSRGFGFIRFKNIDDARKAIGSHHHIGGRVITVKVKQEKQMSLFIARLPPSTTKEELREAFEKYGELTDVYLPTPFRNFAFITYASTEDGRRVLNKIHTLKGNKLQVEERQSGNRYKDTSRNDNRTFGKDNRAFGNNDRGFGRDNNRGFGDRPSSSRGRGRGGFNNPRDFPGPRNNILEPNRNLISDLNALLGHYLGGL